MEKSLRIAAEKPGLECEEVDKQPSVVALVHEVAILKGYRTKS